MRLMISLGITTGKFETPARNKLLNLLNAVPQILMGVRELGISQIQLALRFGISQPTLSMAVSRGKQLDKDRNFSIL